MHRKLRLDCAGKTSRQVLEDLVKEFTASPNGRRIVLLVENLQGVQDSLSQLLRKLLQFFSERDVRASIIDPSGCAATLYDALGGSVHVEVCRDESEVSTPKEILLVEDTEDSLEFVRTLLEQAGHRVTAVRTGRDALRAFERGRFDLVLLDLVLPDIDGMAVARQLSEKRAPLVAMSAYLDQWEDPDFERAGFRRRLRKPFRLPELLAAVRSS